MATVIDMTGEICGWLTVIAKAQSGPKGARWLCRCVCGNEKAYYGTHLRIGARKSCGCSGRTPIDLTGQRFGRLLVLHRSTKRPGYWACQCNCGNVKLVRPDSLARGVKSCGCLYRQKHQLNNSERICAPNERLEDLEDISW